MASTCQHCGIDVEPDDEDYCSFECEQAYNDKPIPCRFCEGEFLTVGRYRWHVESQCPKASTMFTEQQKLVLDRAGGTCQRCVTAADDLTATHVIDPDLFESIDAANRASNLVALCLPCLDAHEPTDPAALYRAAAAGGSS